METSAFGVEVEGIADAGDLPSGCPAAVWITASATKQAAAMSLRFGLDRFIAQS